MVVRGTDDRIYENVLDPGGRWSGWRELPGGGLTIAQPATTVYRRMLHLGVLGTDRVAYLNRLDRRGAWRGWAAVPGERRLERAPGLAVHEGGLWLIAREPDNEIAYAVLWSETWQGWARLPIGGRTPSRPAALRYEDKLWLVVRGTDDALYLGAHRSG